MEKIDWSLVPSFLAVADQGSLSAAARSSGTSQPTLGRHIRQLEDDLATTLFRRQARGLDLTEAGAALLPAARAMADAAAKLEIAASGRSESLRGTVRLTASLFVAHYLLPPILAAIRETEPLIEIELVATDSSENLLYREADIALRMYRPTQMDVVTRHLGDLPLGLFASRDYLDRRGTPQSLADFNQHMVVGYDRDERIIEAMRAFGVDVGRGDFPVRCDNQTIYWELVRAGCGIGAGQVAVAAQDPDIVQVLPDLPIPPLPVWLAAHETLRRTPRLRRVWDLIAEHLAPRLS